MSDGQNITSNISDDEDPMRSVGEAFDDAATDKVALKEAMKGKWDFNKACSILEHSPETKGLFALNELTDEIIVTGRIPGAPGRPRKSLRQERLKDSEILALVRWFNRKGFYQANKDKVFDAIVVAAEANSFHPLADYLNSLEWDGTKRLDTWLTDYLGVEESEYARRVGAMTMIGGASRWLNPGGKMDTILVLSGAQGAGKSTVVSIIAAREDWFSDRTLDFKKESKDTSAHLARKGVIELAEMATVKLSDTDEFKSFITRQHEEYRPPYAKTEIRKGRSCFFIGTVNENTYLRDRTGNRRFWPVNVGRIDKEGLVAVRDQLWAEATARFLAGEKWWVDEEEEFAVEVRAEQEKRKVKDAWITAISEFLHDRDWTCIAQIEKECLGQRLMGYKGDSADRVRKCLEALDWMPALTDAGKAAVVGTRGDYKGNRKWVQAEAVMEKVPF